MPAPPYPSRNAPYKPYSPSEQDSSIDFSDFPAIPEGSALEWKIKPLENDEIELRPVDDSMTLYLSYSLDEDFTPPKAHPSFRVKSGTDTPNTFGWAIYEKATSQTIGTIGFHSIITELKVLQKPFLLPAEQKGPTNTVHHVQAQALVLSFILTLSITDTLSLPPWTSFFWGVIIRLTRAGLEQAMKLGFKGADGVDWFNRLAPKKGETEDTVGCTFGMFKEENEFKVMLIWN